MKKTLYTLVVACLLVSQVNAQHTETKIAFLADVHLQDLFGTLSDSDYKGLLIPKTDETVLMRTMEAQLHSTRIFNENYFAFRTALEDIASRHIHLVALPGDYTDDGQPLHIRGLKKLLNQFSKEFDIQFFITTGNHDPATPFMQESGKTDFLGKDGRQQPIFSAPNLYKPKGDELPVVVSTDLAKMGYSGIAENLSAFGFTAQPEYTYWATPFSEYTADTYTFEKAQQASALVNRSYSITPTQELCDLSYVVEVTPDVWLLALDGDVFIPTENGGFKSASVGYNEVLTHKKHLLPWVKKIVKEAASKGKTLLAFSHFPMIDFNDDASTEIASLMGSDHFQLERVPVEQVAEDFADAGLKVHVAGHMHINDTGIRTTATGNTLVNIQAPSLAAYLPAYKILTVKPTTIEVETIPLKQVTDFDLLFPLYKTELKQLQTQDKETIWDQSILSTKNYEQFTAWHLKELVRLRFLPNDFPQTLRTYLPELSGSTLLLLAQNTASSPEIYLQKLKTDLKFRKAEEQKLKRELKRNKLNLHQFEDWKGMDLLVDFYKIRSADELAFDAIGTKRLRSYSYLTQCWIQKEMPSEANELDSQLVLFFTILKKFRTGKPSDHFTINKNTGAVTRLD